jgi:signal transduction histidine kinase
MAISYVLVSGAAVLLVEAVLLAVAVPQLLSANQAAAQARERATSAEQDLARLKVGTLAHEIAVAAGDVASDAPDQSPAGTEEALLRYATTAGFTSLAKSPGGGGSRSGTVLVLAGTDGRIVASWPADAFAPHAMLPAAARGDTALEGRTATDQDQVSYWASAPIELAAAGGTGRAIGIAYVVVHSAMTAPPGGDKGGPPSGDQPDGDTTSNAATTGTTIGSLVLPGVVVLVLLLPVGALFGLLSTGRLIRRIRRLAQGTAAMTAGDLRIRFPVSGGDEVGRLEHAFNSMVERLDAAVEEQRAAAGAEARRAERTRIARELHDSISQDLFSVNLLAAGMRRALPAGTALRAQAESMERSLGRTMREMRALLLELRPIALEDDGLAAAIEQLCRAYEARLGIRISAHIDLASREGLDAPVEHAVLRVIQESVGNAVRHGEPSSIELILAAGDGHVELTVRDDGYGFDPQSAAGRHGTGLELMRERVRELGGRAEFVSAPACGTTVRVVLPTRSDTTPP